MFVRNFKHDQWFEINDSNVRAIESSNEARFRRCRAGAIAIQYVLEGSQCMEQYLEEDESKLLG